MENKEENRICQNCKSEFIIAPEDFLFYEKIQVPPPTWCVECRQRRRYAWRNERNLYRRNCDLCKKSTITIYSPNKPHKVYCNECWWSDKWDPAEFGRDFDFSRSFFEQFKELQLVAPRMALLNKNSTDSEYTNHSANNKNAFMSFCIFDCENILHSNWVLKNSRDCLDCSYIPEKGERLYECVDSRTSYQSQYCVFLKDCSSCLYCYDCRGCNDCFMSSNLRNKSYVFRNVQYTREEYLEKIKSLKLSSYDSRSTLEKEFEDMLSHRSIHKYAINERIINSQGSLLFDCKNVSCAFEIEKGENAKYIYGAVDIKDSIDIYHAGYNLELGYELQGCTRLSNCQFCHLCYDDMNLMYCDTCQNSQNLFGCVSVKKGEYMILNKKYSKEEYLNLKQKIIEHMKSTGEYGEFFPINIAPVFYNETQASLYMPMQKEEVLSKRWNWEDNTSGTFGKETVKASDIPDTIEEVNDEFLKEILSCVSCNKNYNISRNELIFYKKEGIPIPRNCPGCRYKRRFFLRPTRKLWKRICMCNKNHEHHLSGQVNKYEVEFETPYAPDRPEIVYCEKCYQQEVY